MGEEYPERLWEAKGDVTAILSGSEAGWEGLSALADAPDRLEQVVAGRSEIQHYLDGRLGVPTGLEAPN